VEHVMIYISRICDGFYFWHKSNVVCLSYFLGYVMVYRTFFVNFMSWM
jgi:hypothetical protein